MSTSTSPTIKQTPAYSWQWIALLGLLTALGPLSIDMYLPALPSMAHSFNTTTESISNSVPAYFLGLAIGQLLHGTLSDRVGRKLPLYFGLAIYIVASLMCALAFNEWTLILARVLQAFGGCAGVVIARAAIRDSLDVDMSAQALAHMVVILAVAPIIAPLLGTLFIQFFSWHSIFVVLALIGLITLVCVHLFFKETLAVENRLHLSLKQVILLYGNIWADASFRTPMLAMSFLSGMMFCYITSASALFMEYFTLSQQQFAAVFAMNAAGIMLFSFINSKIVKRIGVLPLLYFGAILQLIGVLLVFAAAFYLPQHLYLVMLGLFLVVANIGLTGPNATALALSQQQKRAAMASALMGSIQFVIGLFAGLMVYYLHGSTLQNIAITMLVYAIVGLACIYIMRFRQYQQRSKIC